MGAEGQALQANARSCGIESEQGRTIRSRVRVDGLEGLGLQPEKGPGKGTDVFRPADFETSICKLNTSAKKKT